MEIIIPANRIEGDINSQVIVDNEITKVVVKNYTMQKKSETEADDIVVYTSDYADNVFSDYNFSTSKNLLGYDLRRVETYYTKGSIEVRTSAKIDNIKRVYGSANGVLLKSGFQDGNNSILDNEFFKYENWKQKNENNILKKYLRNIEETSFSKELSTPKYQSVQVNDNSYITLKNIYIEGNEYVISLDFNILTRTIKYIYINNATIFGYVNEYEEYLGNSFSINIDASVVDIETKDNLSLTYGEGSKTLSYNTNELFQLGNTYNDGEKEVPISEYVATQVISMYKNGRKTASMTTLTDNLIVSNQEFGNGHYGVYGRLERQIYKVGDNVIPYKVDKSLKELPYSEYLGVPQSFKVAENEVKYSGKLTQTLTTQENTYFILSYDEDLLTVKRNGISIHNGDRVFREEELEVSLNINYNRNIRVYFELNGVVYNFVTDKTGQKYSTIKLKVMSNISIVLNIDRLVKISESNYGESIYSPQFSETAFFPLPIEPALINFIPNKIHCIELVAWVKNSSGTTSSENSFIVSNKEGWKFETTVGQNNSVKLIIELDNDNSLGITYSNSDTEKLTYIGYNFIGQVSDDKNFIPITYQDGLVVLLNNSSISSGFLFLLKGEDLKIIVPTSKENPNWYNNLFINGVCVASSKGSYTHQIQIPEKTIYGEKVISLNITYTHSSIVNQIMPF